MERLQEPSLLPLESRVEHKIFGPQAGCSTSFCLPDGVPDLSTQQIRACGQRRYCCLPTVQACWLRSHWRVIPYRREYRLWDWHIRKSPKMHSTSIDTISYHKIKIPPLTHKCTLLCVGSDICKAPRPALNNSDQTEAILCDEIKFPRAPSRDTSTWSYAWNDATRMYCSQFWSRSCDLRLHTDCLKEPSFGAQENIQSSLQSLRAAIGIDTAGLWWPWHGEVLFSHTQEDVCFSVQILVLS